MAPEASISAQDAHASRPSVLDENMHVVEIAIAGFVATIAADRLGLSGLDLLLAFFFSTTLAGQFLTTFLEKMRRS